MAGLAGDRWAASLTQQQVCSLGSVTPDLCGSLTEQPQRPLEERSQQSTATQHSPWVRFAYTTANTAKYLAFPQPSARHSTENTKPFYFSLHFKANKRRQHSLQGCPFVLGTHFLPEVSQYSSGEASSLRQHRGRGAQAPTLCTLNGCQVIQWQHLLPKTFIAFFMCH